MRSTAADRRGHDGGLADRRPEGRCLGDGGDSDPERGQRGAIVAEALAVGHGAEERRRPRHAATACRGGDRRHCGEHEGDREEGDRPEVAPHVLEGEPERRGLGDRRQERDDARRPTVSAALQTLSRGGVLTRRGDRT